MGCLGGRRFGWARGAVVGGLPVAGSLESVSGGTGRPVPEDGGVAEVVDILVEGFGLGLEREDWLGEEEDDLTWHWSISPCICRLTLWT